MKPKKSTKGDANKSAKYDRCQTPAYAFEPLLPYLLPECCIWEPASGDGNLSETMRANGYAVEESDLLTGENFFDCTPPIFDVLITNPPYSVKYKWIARCYEIGKPFALLMPLETAGANKGWTQFSKNGIGIVLLSQRVNFKMPIRGLDGNGAQFPVAWFCHGLGFDGQIVYSDIDNRSGFEPRKFDRAAQVGDSRLGYSHVMIAGRVAPLEAMRDPIARNGDVVEERT